MLTLEELNLKLLSELREIAGTFALENTSKLSKKDLIYRILDKQALSPEPLPSEVPSPAKSTPAKRKRTVKAQEAIADPLPTNVPEPVQVLASTQEPETPK